MHRTLGCLKPYIETTFNSIRLLNCGVLSIQMLYITGVS